MYPLFKRDFMDFSNLNCGGYFLSNMSSNFLQCCPLLGAKFLFLYKKFKIKSSFSESPHDIYSITSIYFTRIIFFLSSISINLSSLLCVANRFCKTSLNYSNNHFHKGTYLIPLSPCISTVSTSSVIIVPSLNSNSSIASSKPATSRFLFCSVRK